MWPLAGMLSAWSLDFLPTLRWASSCMANRRCSPGGQSKPLQCLRLIPSHLLIQRTERGRWWEEDDLSFREREVRMNEDIRTLLAALNVAWQRYAITAEEQLD